jgi:hypothetical protein
MWDSSTVAKPSFFLGVGGVVSEAPFTRLHQQIDQIWTNNSFLASSIYIIQDYGAEEHTNITGQDLNLQYLQNYLVTLLSHSNYF